MNSDLSIYILNTIFAGAESLYLSKRVPEDGEIDWQRANINVYNFVRALTKPYPGAFS